MIALLVRSREFTLTPNAGVPSMPRTAPGLPLRQARVHHLALLPMVAALPETLDRRPTSRRFFECGLLLLLLRVLRAHVEKAIDQCPLQVAGLACRLPEVFLLERDRSILGATESTIRDVRRRFLT